MISNVEHVLFQVMNLIFLILFLMNTFCNVWNSQEDNSVVAKEIHIGMKISTVHGVCWIAEIISFFLNWFERVDRVYKQLFFYEMIFSKFLDTL